MSSRAEKTEELSNSVVGKGKREFDANVIVGTFDAVHRVKSVDCMRQCSLWAVKSRLKSKEPKRKE